MTMTIDHPRPDRVDPRAGSRLLTRRQRYALTRVLERRLAHLGRGGSKMSWKRLVARAERFGMSPTTLARYCGLERTSERTIDDLAKIFGYADRHEMLAECAAFEAAEFDEVEPVVIAEHAAASRHRAEHGETWALYFEEAPR